MIVSSEKQAEIISSRDSLPYFFAGVLMANSGYMYFARNIKIPTLVVKAKDFMHPLFETETCENMTCGGLEFYEIPRQHKTILLPPYVDKLSEIINRYFADKGL